MGTRRVATTAICVALMVGLILSACKPAPPVSKETIKIASIYPLSGSIASAGGHAKDAIDLAVDIINNKHPDLDLPFAKTEGIPALGNRKIEVLFGDSQGTPEVGMAETERLIGAGVVAVTGCYQSAVTKTASQAAERLATPFIDADAISPALAERGFKWYFQTTPDSNAAARDMAKILERIDVIKNVNTKTMKFGMLMEDTDSGRDTEKSGGEILTKAGYTISTKILYPHGASDLTSEVMKLKSEGVEILWQQGYETDAILFVKTMKELGWTPKAILSGSGGATSPDFLKALGKDGDYWITGEYFSKGAMAKKPQMKAVNDLYKAKYGVDLDSVSIRAFQAIFVLADALQRAASTDKVKLLDALKATDLSSKDVVTTWDGVKFDERGYNIRSSYVFHQIRNAEYRLVWPADLAEVDIVFPMPAWKDR